MMVPIFTHQLWGKTYSKRKENQVLNPGYNQKVTVSNPKPITKIKKYKIFPASSGPAFLYGCKIDVDSF